MNIKSYVVSFSMFATFSLFPMELYNSSQITSVNGTNVNRTMWTEEYCKNNNNNGNNNYMERYINAVEEEKAARLTNIHNKIDAEHLGITNDIYFKRLVGSWRSFYKSCYLTNEQVRNEMNQIESYITEDKERVLEDLEKQHWHVYYSLQALVQAKVKEIANVKGSTVDVLYNPTTQEGFERMVHVRALKKYFDKSDIKESLFDGVPMGKLGDIHWAILY